MDPLEIPEFLKREPSSKRITYRAPRAPKAKMPKLPFGKRPPRSKNYRGATRVRIGLTFECPSIGSGVRYVWAKRGTKWAYLCDSLGNRGKLLVTDFDRLTKNLN